MPRPVPVSVLPVFIRLLVGRLLTKCVQVGVATLLVEACFQNLCHSPKDGAEEEIWHPANPSTPRNENTANCRDSRHHRSDLTVLEVTRMQDTAQRVTSAEFLPEWAGVLRRCPSPISPFSIAVLGSQALWNDPSRATRIGHTPRRIGGFPSTTQGATTLGHQLVNAGGSLTPAQHISQSLAA